MINWRRFRLPRFTTVVGRGTVIRGDVEFSDGLHLDGRIEGNVISGADDGRATLTVSDTGEILGNVRVANVILNGAVQGDVRASGRVELAEQARVSGRVDYRVLEMAMGAEVNGELVHVQEGAGSGDRAREGAAKTEPNLD